MTSFTASTPAAELLVRKTIDVAAPPARAFAVFTDQMATWWPLESHHVGRVAARDVVIEPRAGGRWLERGVDGSECVWGHVRVWEPPTRVVLSWELGADFRPDARIQTEVEVRFIAVGSTSTRVELEHRRLEAYGELAGKMRATFDSDGGWTSLVAAYAKATDATG